MATPVLRHGLGGNHAIWWRQVEPLATRHTRHHLGPARFRQCSLESGNLTPVAAPRELRSIIDHLDLGPCHVVGQSMGGWTALGLAVEHPESLRSLVLSTTLAGADSCHVDQLVKAEPGRDRLNRRSYPVLGSAFCAEHPDLAALYNQIASFGEKPAAADVLRAMARTIFASIELGVFPGPTLVQVAEDDDLCPPAAMGGLVSTMRDAAMRTIPGGHGHSVHFENPEVWNSAVLEFVDSVDRRSD